MPERVRRENGLIEYLPTPSELREQERLEDILAALVDIQEHLKKKGGGFVPNVDVDKYRKRR